MWINVLFPHGFWPEPGRAPGPAEPLLTGSLALPAGGEWEWTPVSVLVVHEAHRGNIRSGCANTAVLKGTAVEAAASVRWTRRLQICDTGELMAEENEITADSEIRGRHTWMRRAAELGSVCRSDAVLVRSAQLLLTSREAVQRQISASFTSWSHSLTVLLFSGFKSHNVFRGQQIRHQTSSLRSRSQSNEPEGLVLLRLWSWGVIPDYAYLPKSACPHKLKTFNPN